MVKVERSVVIHAPLQVVWELLATQEGMRRWFEEDMEIDVRIGGKHRHVDKETGQLITGEVLELVPHQRLVLSWLEDGPDTDWVHPIRFSFTLAEHPEGTVVHFVTDGFEKIGKPTWWQTFEAYDRGADRHKLLWKLREAAEGNHVDRR
ncbi:SRPBCC domain-containing protein [Brevibacillus sp. SYP-B805]|uniref:SRPBCC family protein n=1 Tax=Brevibacillus sp. SYP-B805 TaxID=1578199 RepID=UPI0013E9E695|nr:SRPBCC domain-containing protein [Brevibacillus sp. SYP-B805]NGQ96625.1 SRPBCC domain-containing protein [Brevibacillus sp. SYP-B805]